MRTYLSLFLVIVFNSVFAQTGNRVSFALEELDPPADMLSTSTVDKIGRAHV